MANNGFYYFSETGLVHSSIGYEITFDFTNLTNPRTYTFLDSSGTIVLLGSDGFIPNSEINWGSPGNIGVSTPSTIATNNLTITTGGYIRPSTNSTTAILLTKADGTTIWGSLDTTNLRLGLGASTTPSATLHLFGAALGIGQIITQNVTTPGDYIQGLASNNSTKLWFIDSAGQPTFGNSTSTLTVATIFCSTSGTGALQFSGVSGNSDAGAIKYISGNTMDFFTNRSARARLDGVGNFVAGGTTNQKRITAQVLDAGTTTVVDCFASYHQSSGTAAAGFGSGYVMMAKYVNDQTIGFIRSWATNVTFTAGSFATAGHIGGTYNAASTLTERPVMFWGVNGAGNPLWSIFSVTTPIVQPVNSTALDTMATNLGLRASGGVSNFDTDVKISNVGNGIYIKEGTNATMGIATLVAGTVTVNTTKVTANSRIFISVNGVGVLANLGSSYENTATRVAGTSFDIKSTNVLDTSSVVWCIIEPA